MYVILIGIATVCIIVELIFSTIYGLKFINTLKILSMDSSKSTLYKSFLRKTTISLFFVNGILLIFIILLVIWIGLRSSNNESAWSFIMIHFFLCIFDFLLVLSMIFLLQKKREKPENIDSNSAPSSPQSPHLNQPNSKNSPDLNNDQTNQSDSQALNFFHDSQDEKVKKDSEQTMSQNTEEKPNQDAENDETDKLSTGHGSTEPLEDPTDSE